MGSQVCSGNIASLSPNPMTTKAKAANTVRVWSTAGSRVARSAMLSEPVIMYIMPTPMM